MTYPKEDGATGRNGNEPIKDSAAGRDGSFSDPKETKELSVCCNAEKKATVSDEGTGYYQCADCGKEFISNQLSTYEESIVNPHPDELEAVKGKELETWEKEFDYYHSRFNTQNEQYCNLGPDGVEKLKFFIRKIESQAFERGQLKGEQNVSMEKRRCYKMGKEEAIEEIENWTCNNGISHKKSFVALIKFLETLKSKTP